MVGVVGATVPVGPVVPAGAHDPPDGASVADAKGVGVELKAEHFGEPPSSRPVIVEMPLPPGHDDEMAAEISVQVTPVGGSQRQPPVQLRESEPPAKYVCLPG